MPLKQENILLGEKIVAGIKKAQLKLLEQRARNNDTVVISVNGIPQNVPAKEILAARSRVKRS